MKPDGPDEIRQKLEDLLFELATGTKLPKETIGCMMLQYGVRWLYESGLHTDEIRAIWGNFLKREL